MPLTLALVLSAASQVLPATPSALDPGELRAYVGRVQSDLGVPGIAVAVVKDGQVALAEGYGVRRAGAPTRVDENTLFAIASNTKAFTCAALSILVEEGRLGWDDPVTRYVPELHMYDPWVTRELTVRDLVTHRAGLGLGAGDLMWWPRTDLSRDEILRGVRHLRPASSFRSRYAYNNVMYIVAGEVVSRVCGRSWREFVRSRILEPLGMDCTTTSATAVVPGGNVAAPHVRRAGEARPIGLTSFENAAGAVGIHSSAADMARWLRMLLECRREAGARELQVCVLEAASIEQMWSAQTVMRAPPLPRELEALEPDFLAYGLGFRVEEYLGRKLVSHGGAVPGFLSRVTLVPEERLGIVVLTNQEVGAALGAVTYHLLDAYLGPPEPPVDWVRAFRERAAEREAKAQERVARDAAARDAESRPSLPLSLYTATYRDPWYGEATVGEEEQGHLVLTMTRTPGMVGDLEHWQHDTFVAHWRETYMSDDLPCDAYVTFDLDYDGSVELMTMTPVSPAIDFSFDFRDLRFTPVTAGEPEGPSED